MTAFADRVKETTTTTGTGNITTAGAATNFQSINSAIGQNVYFAYAIVHQTLAEWETGIGYLSGATTLVREFVRESSNAGAAVNFSAGTKDVFVTPIADVIMGIGQQLAMMSGTALP